MMDKKKIAMTAAIMIPGVALIGSTVPVETSAKDTGLIAKKESSQQLKNVNPATVVDFEDEYLALTIKEQLGIDSTKDLTVQDLQRLVILDVPNVGGQKISSLKGLEYAENLEELDLAFHDVENIQPLLGLVNLKKLDLSGNILGSISGLESLVELEELSVSNILIDDASSISALTKLKKLDVSNNNIADTSFLSSLGLLEELRISNNPLSEIHLGFNRLLKKLDISLTNITKLDSIAGLRKLQSLDISRTGVESLEGIELLSELEFLNLNDTNVSDIGGLAKIKTLVEVSGDRTKVFDFSPVSHVPVISFNDIELTMNARVNGQYLKIPVTSINGEQINFISSSHGEWDRVKKSIKLTTTPIDGDIIEAYFRLDSKISGKVLVTVSVDEVSSPVILVNQNTGEVTIKNIESGNEVYYRESETGDWKKYKDSFLPAPIEENAYTRHYYIEAVQTNGLIESEIASTAFTKSSIINPVQYTFDWWNDGRASLTLKHDDENAEIMYQIESNGWKKYSKPLDISNYYKKGKIEVQMYAMIEGKQSEVTKFSTLTVPQIKGVKGENKIEITHPLSTVDLYYRVNGGEWKFYSEPFAFDETGEYVIETYAKQSEVESLISLPVTVKVDNGNFTTDDSANNKDEVVNNGNGSGGAGNQNTSNGGESSEKLPDTGIQFLPSFVGGVLSTIAGALLVTRKRR